METNTQKVMQELTTAEIDQVAGGIIFAPVLYTAFVSGAKWGGGMALAAYAIHAKMK
jgi:hypothetical protein